MPPFVRLAMQLTGIWLVMLFNLPQSKAEGIFTIGTGSVVGLYYQTAAEICRNYNRTKPDSSPKCHTLTTGGSLDNLEALKRKEIDIAIVQSDLIEQAINATGAFEGRSPFIDLRGLLALHLEPMTVVAKAGSNISDFDDLLGQRFDVANPSSGTRTSVSTFLSSNGIDYQDFSLVTEFKGTEQDKNLCRGRIDAFAFMAGHPNRAIERAAEKCSIQLVSFPEKTLQALMSSNPGIYSKMSISGEVYGLNSAPVSTFGVRAVVVTHKDSDPDLIENFTNQLLIKLPHLQQWHPAFADLTLGQMISSGLLLPFHTGAQNSFSQAGLMEAPRAVEASSNTSTNLSMEDLDTVAELASDLIELNDRFPKGFKDYRQGLISYYRNDKPEVLWAKSKNARDQLLQTLHAVVSDGLNPGDYPVQALKQLSDNVEGTTDLVSLARAEATFSTLFAFYASDLKIGRLKPRAIDPELFVQTKRLDVEATLIELSEATSLHQFVASFRSSNPEYRALRSLLSKHQTILVKGGWPTVPTDRVLKPDMSGSDVAILRQRLEASHDISVPSDRPDLFDTSLKMAVKRFQDRHGLEADGIVGKGTYRQLNIPVIQRIKQIIVNMERWRWMPENMGDNYILVNIAGFEMRMIEQGSVKEHMAVVVGKPFRKTPVFSDEIEYLEFNPYWTVPYKIAVEDELPQILADPSFIERMGFQVLESGTEIDPYFVDWNSLSKDYFPYTLRQLPGPKNALGRVKFMFPNDFSIYLHDSPARSLFSKAVRTYSSGCIRLQRPLDLAEKVLQQLEGWDRQRIDDLIESKERTVVPLKQKLPVHLTYATAWSGEGGTVNFRDDVYERDLALYDALF
jgi:L,D-transpeptidase YcbB